MAEKKLSNFAYKHTLFRTFIHDNKFVASLFF